MEHTFLDTQRELQLYDILELPLESHFSNNLSLRDTLALSATCKDIRDLLENSEIFVFYAQNRSPPPEFRLSRRQWALLNEKASHYYQRCWVRSWDDQRFWAIAVRWHRSNQFFFSSNCPTNLKIRRIGLDVVGGMAGGVGGGYLVFKATVGGAKAGAVVGTCTAPGPGTVIGTIAGGVVGAAAGILIAESLWSASVCRETSYRKFKKLKAREELEHFIKDLLPSSDPMMARYSCRLQRCLPSNMDSFVEDRNGYIYDLNELRRMLGNQDPSTVISVTPLSFNPPSYVAEEAADGLIGEQGQDISYRCLQAVMSVNQHVDEDEEAIVSPVEIKIGDLCWSSPSPSYNIPCLSELTAVKSYRTAYAVACRRLYLLKFGFIETRIEQPELKKALNRFRTAAEGEVARLRLLAEGQIKDIVGETDINFRVKRKIKFFLYQELDRATTGEAFVEFTPLLDLSSLIEKLELTDGK